MAKIAVASWNDLADRKPTYALVGTVDLVVTRFDDQVSVLYGRCLHRGALMSDGHVEGDDLICGLHGWDYRLDTGVSEYNDQEVLPKFRGWVEEGSVWVDNDEIAAWAKDHPQPYQRDSYQGLYQDHSETPDEPHVKLIQKLAGEELSKLGHHGPVAAMGVSRRELPTWGYKLSAQQIEKELDAALEVGVDYVILDGRGGGAGAGAAPPIFRDDISGPTIPAVARDFAATVEPMEVMARACGHDRLNQFAIDDLTTFDRQMSDLTGVAYGGVKGR